MPSSVFGGFERLIVLLVVLRGFAIRRATPADAGRLNMVLTLVASELHLATPPSVSILVQMMHTPGSSWLIAEELLHGRRAIGLVSRRLHVSSHGLPARGHVSYLAVVPRWRRRGVARALVCEAVAELDARHACSTLYVHPTNTCARSLYEKFGYRAHALVPGYYRSYKGDQDALLYVRHRPYRVHNHG